LMAALPVGLIAACTAFSLTVVFAPIVIHFCARWKLFDQPGPLKIHDQPVPRLGGVALVLAVAAAAFLASPAVAVREWPFFAALGLIWIVGLIDDLRGFPVLFRLAAQMAAGVLLWHGGSRFPIAGSTAINFLATCGGVGAAANGFNFLDGADGIASGIAGIIAVAFALLPGASGKSLAHTVAWSVAGACAGFLISNHPPAKIHMGDSGSTALGFLIAFLALDFSSAPTLGTSSGLFFLVLIPALPLFDLLFAVIRRLRSGSSPFYGDRAHFYDLLSARGLPPRKVALLCYAIAAAFAIIGSYGARHDSTEIRVAAACSVALFTLVAIRLGSLQRNDGDRQMRSVLASQSRERTESAS
jgi:UDP-GlcNAc:undecaprenyl-phosphate/decaprenyl-phosphate GlcNAc-1-phosphate transferase